MTSPQPVRCAIYTRKSTEEGLEQDFNTLDAQRQSGELYVESQSGEGWVCLPDHYDDGGFTGGNMDRPALTRLLADIESGKIDCVVVYKVDRLSRSLMDFARMMSVFEQHGAAFVSVTQQFNTTDSMGRLMLNVLLSFAQFERELISERTRDKIAAARRKGKWVGGRPVLGYDLEPGPGGSRLVVNDSEAAQVRAIFDLYLRERSLLRAARACRDRGWTTKRWTTKAGKAIGGRVMDKTAVHAVLTNVVYRGQVRHHDAVYEGEQEAIVEPELFDRVQQQLRLNGRTGGSGIRNTHGALLKGLIRCGGCGAAMAHHFTSRRTGKGSKRYHYYVCTTRQKQGREACASPSLPAGEIEQFVIDQIRERAMENGTLAAIIVRATDLLRSRDPARVVDRDELVGAVEAFEPLWNALVQSEREEIIRSVVERLDYDAGTESVTLVLREQVSGVGGGMSQTITRTVHFARSGRGRRELRIGAEPTTPEVSTGRIPRVARLMALAIKFDGLIRSGAVSDQAEIARLGHVTRARVSQIMHMNSLAPDIQEAILYLPRVERGRDPVTERDLRPLVAELDWGRQRVMWEERIGGSDSSFVDGRKRQHE